MSEQNHMADKPDKEEVERKKREIKDTLCCPYCGERMKKWAVPQNMFTTWPNEFMYICFNDECPYFISGFEAVAKMGNAGSFRLMYDPLTDTCQPVAVINKRFLKESIVDESDNEQEIQEISVASLIGTWRLISSKLIADDGQVSYPLGQELQGMLIYLEDGHMSVQNMPADGALFQTPEGKVIALETYGTYNGRYEIGSSGTVVHYIENSLFPAWNNRRQERSIKIDGDRLMLVSPPIRVEGRVQIANMVWKRTC